MSRIVVIEKNKNGKVELSKEELQQMLDDAYHQGYSDGKGSISTITYPSYPSYYPWTITCNSDSIPMDKVTIKGSSECADFKGSSEC